MARYSTRRVERPSGFYRALHAGTSLVDTDDTGDLCLRERDTDQEGVYEVERLVQRRDKGGRAEYLVLWAGYRKEEASWVSREHITRPALEYYDNPNPSIRQILDTTSAFTAGITRSLKMGVNRACRITVSFRTDVFRFLFEGKGSRYEHGPGYVYHLKDFDATYFPDDWHRVYDHLGDGCEVQFPIRLHNKLTWEPTVYKKDTNLFVKKKLFEEVCIISLLKQRI